MIRATLLDAIHSPGTKQAVQNARETEKTV